MKSYKREIGAAVLGLWFAVTLKVFFLATPETIAALEPVYNIFTMVALPVGLAPFGLHAVLNRSAKPVEGR